MLDERKDEPHRSGTPPARTRGGAWMAPPPRTSLLLQGRGATAKGMHTMARPMTSNKAAGYSAGSLLSSGSLSKRPSNMAALADHCAELEDRVHSLLEQGATAASQGDKGAAMHAAREAARTEHKLCTLREQAGQVDLINLQLKFAVGLNLATCYQEAGKLEEALRAYNEIMRSQLFAQAGWLRLSIGNIHCQQQRYGEATKCYRMALDSIPPVHRRLRLECMRNMASALLSAGCHPAAVEILQTILQEGADHRAAFNLVACACVMQDQALASEALGQLLAVPLYLTEGQRDSCDGEAEVEDVLSLLLAEKQAEAERLILVAARLAAPVVGNDWAQGFQWCQEQLVAAGCTDLADQLQLAKAAEHMWRGSPAEAAAVLRKLRGNAEVPAPPTQQSPQQQQQQSSIAATAAGLDYLEGRSHHPALPALMSLQQQSLAGRVNEGNLLLASGDAQQALAAYEEALHLGQDGRMRLQPAYNAGLACRQLGQGQRAMQLFMHVLRQAPTQAEAMLQVADLCEEAGDVQGAAGWLTRLLASMPHDAGILSRLGAMQAKAGADGAALQCYLEAFRADPTSLDTISWLGAYEVRKQNYAGAIPYFEAAARAQPRDTKWRLMVAGCLRRTGQLDAAAALYRAICVKDPMNAEALRYLAQLGGS